MFLGFRDVLEKLLIAKATPCILSLLGDIEQSPEVFFWRTALLLESFLATSDFHKLEKKIQERLIL